MKGRDPVPCRSAGSDLWFSARPADVEDAKALCRSCPLLHGCREGALQRAEPWGVWGGELFLGGRIVPYKRAVGRPRKQHRAA